MGEEPNVGLAWAGNPGHELGHHRSLAFERLRAYLPPSIRWWCVQKHIREHDARVLEGAAEVERPSLEDFADTAGLLANLDVMVTVDTSIAHLAGALGRPTLVLLPQPSEWRWQTGRADSPWYRSLRLIRQHMPGDWDSALRDMAAQLRTLAS